MDNDLPTAVRAAIDEVTAENYIRLHQVRLLGGAGSISLSLSYEGKLSYTILTKLATLVGDLDRIAAEGKAR